MLTSFGEEISQTPLQFAALMSAIANGGTLYCLQYPRNAQEIASFTPKVKRKLNIEAPIFRHHPRPPGSGGKRYCAWRSSGRTDSR